MTDRDVPILCTDEPWIIVEKPSGLLTAPGLGPENADSLLTRLLLEFNDVRVVHRLDRDTSGLIVFARGAAAERNLSLQFQRREVEKRYEAIVEGAMAQSAGRIEAPLRKDLDRPPRQLIDFAHGKPAVTEWRALERGDDLTRLELAPLTGRSHQLRVHLESIGHPILGDSLYGAEKSRAVAERLMLHATRLSLKHPGSGERVTWISPPPF